MNEKVSKKIGEAYAFSMVLQDLNNKVPEVLKELLSELSESINEATNLQISKFDEIVEQARTTDIVKSKAEKTSAKITNMGEFYVGDDWDDSAEVLEWFSFFVGAAIIHWQLILGCGRELENEELISVSEEGVKYFESLLSESKKKAESIGRERAIS
jgi:hypothetical protein